MKEINFEYIMSALGICGFPEHNDLAKQVINNYLGDIDFDFGMLFNAMTEKDQGPKYFNNYKYKSLMSDSGGLQITTLGLDVTETKKKQIEIYKTQATYSDIAMCFDEMPIELSHLANGAQSRIDTSNRFFIKENVQEKAYETALNIKKQIEVFDSLNSGTKVMIIAQGDSKESYSRYVETIVKNLTDDELKFIHGIAPSGAGNGAGLLNRYDMLYYIKDFEVPEEMKKNIHLLGVGSKDALLPLIANPNYFNFIDNVSFDSSSAPRKYRIDGEGIDGDKFGKEDTTNIYTQKYFKIMKHFQKYFMQIPEWDINTFIEQSTFYSSKNEKKVWMYRDRNCERHNALALLLWYFVPAWKVEQVMNGIKESKNKIFPIFKNINNYQDYLYYRHELIRYYGLNSRKIDSCESIEEMKRKMIIKQIYNDLI